MNYKNDVNSRFIECCNYLLSSKKVEDKTTLAAILDIKPNKLSEILANRMRAGVNEIQKLCSNYKVSYKYLFDGGDMFDGTQDKVYNLSLNKAHDNFIEIPIYDNISAAAGFGAYNSECAEISDIIRMPKGMVDHGHHECIRVKGRSMQPTLLDGGYIICRELDRSEWQYIKDGLVYVITTREGETVIKRIKNRLSAKGFIVCCSDNPDKHTYSNFNIISDELHKVRYAEWYLSAKMPNIHDAYYHEQQQLIDDIDDIKLNLATLMKKINQK